MRFHLLAKFTLAALAADFANAVISESDFFPVIEYWKSGDYRSNQLCQDEVTDATAGSYPARPSSGLRNLSKQLIDAFTTGGRTATKDLEYLAAQRRKNSNWSSMMTAGMRAAVAAGRTGSSTRGFATGLCSMYNAIAPNDWCFNLGNFSQTTQCLSDYTYQDDVAVTDVLAADNDFGWSGIPQECLEPISVGKLPLGLELQRFPTTPDVIDSAVVRAESQVYYVALKAVDHLNRFAEQQFMAAVTESRDVEDSVRILPKTSRITGNTRVGLHDLFQNSDIFETVLPEWTVEKVFMINEPRFLNTGKTLRLPYAVMASRNNDLLFVLASPVTTYESRLALYNQLSLKYLYNFTGEVHDGASTIFQTTSGVIEFAIDRFYDQANLTQQQNPVTITFVAKDLPGSGGAVILASHIQRVLSEKFGSSSAVNVNAITFGTPFIGNDDFTQKIRNVIEVRNIRFLEDSTDTFPCPTTYSCDERVLLPRTGIETGKEYKYGMLPGRVELSIGNLVNYDPAWGKDTAPLQLAAIKDCAYSCFFTRAMCPSDLDDRCSPKSCPSFV